MDTDAIKAQLRSVSEQIDNQYWLFCRCQNGALPSIELYQRKRSLERQLGKRQPHELPFHKAKAAYGISRQGHLYQIQKAIAKGATVPVEVLKEYPEIFHPIA